MSHIYPYILLLCTIVITTQTPADPVQDQPPPPPPMTQKTMSLTQAREIAFARNWDILAAKSNIEAARAQQIIAKEFPNPEISFDVSAINIDGRPNTYEKIKTEAQEITLPTGETINIPGEATRQKGLWSRTFDTVIAVSQLIEIGKRKPRIDAATAGTEEAEAQFRDAKRILDTAVIKAYTDVLLADANLQVLTDSAASMKEEARLAKIRLDSGDISPTELRQMEVEADKLQAEAKNAEAQTTTTRVALTTLLGENDPNENWTPSDALETLATTTQPETSGNDPQRPDLIAAQAALKKAEAELRGQKALRIPDPTLSLGYEHEPPDGPNSIGFTISAPIPTWNRYNGEIHAAQIAREDALREIQKIKAQIASEQKQAAIAYESALEQWNNLTNDIQPKSAQIKENISFAYKKGAVSLLDLLSTQRSDNEIRLNTAQAAATTISTLADLAAARNAEFKTK